MQNDYYFYSMRKTIGIACGGFTSESTISKKSGAVVFEALQKSSYSCYLITIEKEAWRVTDVQGESYALAKTDLTFIKKGERISFDCIVNMIHGIPGENGELATLLASLKIAHTSCAPKEAALTYSKKDCLIAAAEMGIPTAQRTTVRKGESFSTQSIINKVGLPCFVKANQAGSSYGVFKIYTEEELEPAIEKAFIEDDLVLIETALEGREITIGVLDWEGEIKVLPITEIISENDFFDFEAKYEGKSEEITPANLPQEWEDSAVTIAKKLYKNLGLKGITRSEFIFQEGIPHLLEINTIPGMTLQSIIPQQAEAAGISLLELMEGVIASAMVKKM